MNGDGSGDGDGSGGSGSGNGDGSGGYGYGYGDGDGDYGNPLVVSTYEHESDIRLSLASQLAVRQLIGNIFPEL